MKNIKFKAFDYETKKIYKVFSIDFINDMVTLSNGKQLSINDVDMLQWSGELDINGKEIYEGDEVNNKKYAGIGKTECVQEGVVKFRDGQFRPAIKGWDFYGGSSLRGSGWEVVGNQYE